MLSDLEDHLWALSVTWAFYWIQRGEQLDPTFGNTLGLSASEDLFISVSPYFFLHLAKLRYHKAHNVYNFAFLFNHI